MKLEIQREHLLKPLQQVIGVVERRQTLPILSNVLFAARDGELTLTATDLEVEISARSSLEIAEPGETTLPARKLLDILRALPDGVIVSLVIEGDKALLRSGRSRFSLITLPATDLPTLDDLSFDGQIRVPQGFLKSLIEYTHFAMAQQDVRYYLNGLLMDITEEQIRAVATDGHRLALYEVEVKSDSPIVRQLIVPLSI